MNSQILVLILTFSMKMLFCQSFLDGQLEFERVREASKYDSYLQEICLDKGLSYPPKALYIRIFKFDKKLELWGSNGGQYVLIKEYDVCEISGELGPKFKQGDNQIPEGFYHLSQFNPASNYFLSLKVSYPNEADRKRSAAHNLGGDIYIHGDCKTVGCIPILDDPIKELYWLALQVRSEHGSEIPIHLFPFYMDDLSMQYFKVLNLFGSAHWSFWNQLKPAYDYFNNYHLLPQYKISDDGSYAVKE